MDDPDQAAAGGCAAPMTEQQHSPLAQDANNGNINPGDLGSQESIFIQPNFSYVALLWGYLDNTYRPGGFNHEEQIPLSSFAGRAADDDSSAVELPQNGRQEPLQASNCEKQSKWSCFQTVSGDDVAHVVKQTENEQIKNNDQMIEGNPVEASVNQVEDLLHMGVFVEQEPKSSYLPAQTRSSDDTTEDVGGPSGQINDVSLRVPEEDPWRPNLFDVMVLEQVRRIDEDATEAERMGNHTWNLDSPREDDSACSDQDQHQNPLTAADLQSDQTCQNEDNDVNEETIESVLENERQAAVEGNTYNTDSELKPALGMQFKTRDEAHKFFNFYSFVVGFSVTVALVFRTTSRKRDREVTRVTLKCNKHGRNTEAEKERLVVQRQSNVIAKTGCKVEMIITEKNGVWNVTNLNLEHNHELDPSSRFFRSHAYMSAEEKALIRTMKQCNIPTRKIVAVLAYIRGGMDKLPYNKRKVSNYGTQVNRELENSDIMEVMEFYKKKQAETPGFCYSMEVDARSKVRSIFWMDARSRLMYEEYGDCISFDTTFLTNKYNLPFAPIVGVSPHGKTYLFACALIMNETANTFKWLFEQFLAAMGDKPLRSIITDQDKGMKNAIKSVFPKATHRACLFHVKKYLLLYYSN